MAGKYGARRSKLLKRDGNLCYWCQDRMDTGPSARRNPQSPWSCTIEHLRPKAFGGCNHLPNLVLAHQRCNEVRDTDWDGVTHCDCDTWLAGDTHQFGQSTRPGNKTDRSSRGGINVHLVQFVYKDKIYAVVASRTRRGRSHTYEEQ